MTEAPAKNLSSSELDNLCINTIRFLLSSKRLGCIRQALVEDFFVPFLDDFIDFVELAVIGGRWFPATAIFVVLR